MDPLSIASSVVGLTATCLSTCKKLHDLAGEYQDVPAVIAMICSESTIISIGLSELQMKILQRNDLAQAWASKTEIWMAFETALTGCMVVFSCLEAETRSIRSENPGLWAKIKFLWNQDRLKELLGALRAQQSCITFLLNLLELDTLSNIQKDIWKNSKRIKAAASQAQSLRSCSPSVKMDVESIFDNDAVKLSFFHSEAVSGMAPSELDFEFDDVVVNSQAYRRVFIKARSEFQQLHVEDVGSDTGATKEADQGPVGSQKDPSLVRDSQEEAYSYHEALVTSPLRVEDAVRVSDYVVSVPSFVASRSNCCSCSKTITGLQVEALGRIWHLKCFTCFDCGVPLQSDYRQSHEENGIRPKPLCEEDYIQRRDTQCFKCHETIKGNFIAALDRRYHEDHFTCDECEIAFTKKSDCHQQDDGIYCMLHFCRDVAYYCDGCKFPIMEECHVSDEQGGKWHNPCFHLSSSWGLELPVSSNGRRYLDFIQDKSQASLGRLYQQLHDTRANDIYLCCSNFTTGLRNSVAYSLHLWRNQPAAEGYESWRVVLAMLSRLFRSAMKATNNCARADELTSFTSAFQRHIKDYTQGRQPSSQFVGLHISELLQPLLRVTFQAYLQDRETSWDVKNDELDEIITALGAVGTDELGHRYSQQPTGAAKEDWRCANCSEAIIGIGLSERMNPYFRLHPYDCLQSPGQNNCQIDDVYAFKAQQFGEAFDVIPRDEVALDGIWRCWFVLPREISQEHRVYNS